MLKFRFVAAVVLLLAFLHTLSAQTNDPQAAIQDLKQQLETLKTQYEQRIKSLEEQVEQLQIQMLQAPEPGEEVAQAAPAPVQQTIPGALNPAISVVTNFVGRVDNQDVLTEEGDLISDRMNVREAELDFRVPVDPYADGVLITSLESEAPGEFNVGIEEGYVNIKKLPFLDNTPLGMKFKVGRFRPLFGKVNILHTHDLPTTMRPLPIEEFLGEEGFVQQGI